MRPYCRSARSRPARRSVSPRLLVGHHAAGWPPPRSCRRPASAACRGAGSAARPPSRAGSRCGRPCGRPRSRRPSAGSPTSDRSRTRVLGVARCWLARRRRIRSRTAWNFTSSRRAVLSARSRKLPMRRKWKASSCSMVPTVTPRDRCERNLTHSKSALGSRCEVVVCDHALELEPGLVLRLPDLGGQRAAHGARVLARGQQAGADARRVAARRAP